MRRSKKAQGISTSTLVAVIIALVVILGMTPLLASQKTGIRNIFKTVDEMKGAQSDFTPFDPESLVDDDDKIATDSVNALIETLNRLVPEKGSDSNQEDDENSKDTNIKSFKISYSSQIELQEVDDISQHLFNDKRFWVFEKELIIKDGKKVSPNNEIYIYSNYRYGFCGISNKGKWVDCGTGNNPSTVSGNNKCYCNEEDDFPLNGGAMINIPSFLNTNQYYSQANKEKLAAIKDLIPVEDIKLEIKYKDGSSCIISTKKDNNLNQESSKEKDLMTWDKNSGNTLIGCTSSPTWLQCDGIKVYYCGKTGESTSAQDEESEKFYQVINNGELTSRAGTKFKVVFDSELKGSKESHAREGDNVHIPEVNYDEFDNFNLGDKNMEYMKSSNVFCYDGEKYPDTEITFKVVPGLRADFCGFKMPQSELENEQVALDWFSGYGDPKYVMYYEAFPRGEEEAWQISPADVSFTAVALTTTATHVGMPIGGYVISKIADLGKMLTKLPILGRVVKFGAWGTRLTSDTISASSKKIKRLIESGVQRGAQKAISKDLFIRVFTKNNDILNVLAKNPLLAKKIGTNMDSVVDDIIKNAKDPDDVIKLLDLKNQQELYDLIEKTSKEDFIKMLKNKDLSDEAAEATDSLLVTRYIMANDAEVKAAAEQMLSRMDNIKMIKSGVKNNPERALYYGIALTFAWEDSTNQKFEQIGTNNIGMKQPYNYVFLSDGSSLKELNHELNKYHIMLVKDKKVGIGPDQQNTRFYLASPCETDFIITKTKCFCDVSPIVETDKKGKTYKVDFYQAKPDSQAYYRYGNSLFVGPSLKKQQDGLLDLSKSSTFDGGIKECIVPGEIIIPNHPTANSLIKEVDCIKINPVPKNNVWEDNNFCYGGSQNIQEVGKAGILLGTIGFGVITEAVATSGEGAAAAGCPFTLGGSCAAVPLIESTQTMIDIGIEWSAALLMNKVSSDSKWPSH